VIRVLVVDDQAMVREGFAALPGAQPDMSVVGTAGNGREAREASAVAAPAGVVMDVRMAEMGGLAATRSLLAGDASAKVLVLTTFALDDYIFDALAAGASGFLLKHAPATELLHAVRVVAAGEALLAPEVTRRLIGHFVAARPDPAAAGPRPDRLASLTDRETEVLGLVARGLSNTEIADDLVLAEQTVKTHVSRIFAKLGLRDRAQAVVVAYECGLVRPQG